MSVDPSLTISISRTSLALPALVLAGSRSPGALVISSYVEPPQQARITYAPDSAYVEGSTALAAVWQQTFLSFDTFPDEVTATTAKELVEALRAAIAQFAFTVTTAVNDAPGQLWKCDMGSMQAAATSYATLRANSPLWSVTIPCQPTPGAP